MIFVTVGTHEQQFDRLIKEIDNLKSKGIIKEEVFIQLGYCQYIPQHCTYEKMLGYDEMRNKMEKSHIIITHGGPATIIMAWQYGKIPIVVPRQPQFDEHVDEHQIWFCKRLEEQKKIIDCIDINQLKDNILSYDLLCESMILDLNQSENSRFFITRLEQYVDQLFESKKKQPYR